MPYEEAAKVLGSWVGPSYAEMAPGTVVPLDQSQMTELLAETSLRGNKRLESALFTHADSVTRAFFGDDVYCECQLHNVSSEERKFGGLLGAMTG